MRDINFRGLGVDGHWWFGGSKPLDEYRHYNLATFFPNVYAGSIRPETVGEWTGLHDKNGREIYEGDIVILSNVLADGDKKICKAIMDGWQSLFESIEDGFYCPMGNTAQNYLEVIGNIYEGLYSGEHCDILKVWNGNTERQSQGHSKDTGLLKKQSGKSG